MADHSEPVQFRENGQFEHQEQRFDVGNGLETDGVREDDVAGDSVGHRNSYLGSVLYFSFCSLKDEQVAVFK